MSSVLARREFTRWWVEPYTDFLGKRGWTLVYESYRQMVVVGHLYSDQASAVTDGLVRYGSIPFCSERPMS